jgi:hypothetical protein
MQMQIGIIDGAWVLVLVLCCDTTGIDINRLGNLTSPAFSIRRVTVTGT